MAEVNYTARAQGCEIRLRAGRLELVATRTALHDASPKVDGSAELVGNLALVTRLAEYAANELAYRRLRSPEKRKSHKAAAERDLRDAVAIADLVTKRGNKVVSGWCSGCFERT